MEKFFSVKKKVGAARLGMLQTRHGAIHTPAFMPVGTRGAVKAIAPDRVKALGTQIILANTYHLMLRPSAERVAKLGGLHAWMGWDGPILTDSGGFQIMSLASRVKIDKKGAEFRSHIDGAPYMLSPERAMEIQALLGSDIHMVLDECLKLPAEEAHIFRSVDLSLDWAQRSKQAASTEARVFGIVQGGLLEAARIYSAEETIKIGFDGYAVGGLSVGEPQAARLSILDLVLPLLPEDCPRYVMGIGRPDDLVLAVARGADMFDCVLPTREARHGRAYTRAGSINLRNASFAEDARPLDEGSRWSRAYLHHLFNINEPLGMMLLTENNLGYFQRLMRECRAAIEEDRFEPFRDEIMSLYGRS